MMHTCTYWVVLKMRYAKYAVALGLALFFVPTAVCMLI